MKTRHTIRIGVRAHVLFGSGFLIDFWVSLLVAPSQSKKGRRPLQQEELRKAATQLPAQGLSNQLPSRNGSACR